MNKTNLGKYDDLDPNVRLELELIEAREAMQAEMERERNRLLPADAQFSFFEIIRKSISIISSLLRRS